MLRVWKFLCYDCTLQAVCCFRMSLDGLAFEILGRYCVRGVWVVDFGVEHLELQFQEIPT